MLYGTGLTRKAAVTTWAVTTFLCDQYAAARQRTARCKWCRQEANVQIGGLINWLSKNGTWTQGIRGN